MAFHLYHFLNPVRVDSKSDLFIAQPITFESMRSAQRWNESGMTHLVSLQYPEDIEIVPSYFDRTRSLESSVLDFAGFNMKRKLPLIREMFERMYEFSDSGSWIIYTNVDIGVQPFFYDFVRRKIQSGIDSFIINRRTISDRFVSPDELIEMYAEIGDPHPGYDCFVFPRKSIPEFELGNICIGAPYIGLALYINMRAKSNNFEELGTQNLTFHIGNDQTWKHQSNNEYKVHNEKEFGLIKERLLAKHGKVINGYLEEAFPMLK